MNHKENKIDKNQTNIKRTKGWNEYCSNLLSYTGILNPVGVLRGFNTRTYEVMYSGRILLQHTFGSYKMHEKILEGHQNSVVFKDFKELKDKILKLDVEAVLKNADPIKFYNDNNIYKRFKNIGVEIK